MKFPLLPAVAGLLLACSPLAHAFGHGSNDHASVGSDITIAPGEASGDIACAFCSVHIHGDVTGDVAVLFGTVDVDGGKSISGDVAVLGGNVNLANESSVGGDVAIAAGHLNQSETARVNGNRTIASSPIWLILPLAPFLIFAGFIWLIVHLVRRRRYMRYPYPPPPMVRS